MFCRIRMVRLLHGLLYGAVVFGAVAGCSPGDYKAQADKEVYGIIDAKWQDHFGKKANYRISSVPPSPNDLQAEKVQPEGVINLGQAVAIATANNRNYQTQKEQLYLKALDLTLARHAFARQWFGTFDAAYVREAEESQAGYNAGLGFSRFLAMGTQVSTSIALDWARFLSGDPRTSLGSVFSATITQPLLRGSGRLIAQENLTQAERDTLYQIRDFNRYRQTFVVSIINEHYRVLQQRDRVINAENDLQRKMDSKDRLEWEFKAGRRSRIDVDEAGQNVLRAQNSLVRAKQTYEQMLDQFKITLALPTDANIALDQNDLRRLEDMGLWEPDYTVATAVETALRGRLDLANDRDEVDDAMRKVVVAADELRADLNLTAGAQVNSTPRTDYSRLEFHRGTYNLGVESALPLDRKAERNAYRRALITFDQHWRGYKESEDNVKLDVRQAYRELREAADRYDIQRNSLELAKRRVESNELLLDAGRVTVRVLLESQDSLVLAQNEVTAALVDYLIARLSFYRDSGILQVKPDGMWEEVQ